MDNAILRKRLNTFKNSQGRLENVSDEVVMETLRAWELWPGNTAELYRDLDLTKMQMVSLLKKGKRLVKSGIVVESEFQEIPSCQDGNFPKSALTGSIEMVWVGGQVIRFSEVNQLIDFLKKVA